MPRPDQHRDALVAAMRRMLRRQGYGATGLNQLLAAAGATNGSLYHHFPAGKEQLAEIAIRESAAEVQNALRQLFDAVPDPVVAVQAWIDAAIGALERDPRDGCPVTPTAIEAATTSDQLRTTAATAFADWADTLQAALGRTRTDSIARNQARTVLAAIEGALLLDRTAHTTDHLKALRAAIPSLLAIPAGLR